MLVHIHSSFMSNQGRRKGKMKEQGKLYVVVRMWWNQTMVFWLRLSSLSGGAEFCSEVARGFFLVDTTCLLLEHISCIFLLHFHLCRCVCFLECVPIKSESDLPLWQTLSFTVVFHEFANHSLDSFLRLLLGYWECQNLPSCCFSEEIPGPQWEHTCNTRNVRNSDYERICKYCSTCTP